MTKIKSFLRFLFCIFVDIGLSESSYRFFWILQNITFHMYPAPMVFKTKMAGTKWFASYDLLKCTPYLFIYLFVSNLGMLARCSGIVITVQPS